MLEKEISDNVWERQGEKINCQLARTAIYTYFVQRARKMLGHFDFCLPFQIICSITLKKLQKIF